MSNVLCQCDECFDLFHPDFYDLLKVLEMGAKKHGSFNWLDENGSKADHKSMHASMFRHLADSHANNRVDHESGLDPLLHLACRALMYYARIKNGIIHELDK